MKRRHAYIVPGWAILLSVFFLPVISSMRFIKTSVQVGTPEIEVTFSCIVVSASFSILLSHSSISAMLSSGVRIQWLQKGVFCNSTALRSPYCVSSFSWLNCVAAAITRPLPVSRSDSGLMIIVKRQHIFGGLVMAVFQAFFAYGNELAFIAGSAAAFGKPVNGRVP